MKLLRKLRGFFRKEKLDADMSDEMRVHLEMQTQENLARGMSPDEARYAARRQFGGVEQVKEIAREQRAWRWLEDLAQDLRYAARALRKNPSFAITAVLTLALGIGVNAALFTVYNLVALRPLPVKDPDALIKIAGQRQESFFPNFSFAEYLILRDSNRTLSGLVAVNEANAQLRRDDTVVQDSFFQGRDRGTVPVQFVSENYFSLLGGEMALGRGFLPEENKSPGAAPVVVLSHLFWQRHFNADPNVLGRTLTLRNQTLTVIGVTAPEFVGQQPAPPAVWLPLMMWGGSPVAYGPKGPPAFRLIGRLAPGVTEAEAKADLDVIAARLGAEFPGDTAKDSVRLERGMRFVDIPVNAKTVAASMPLLLGFAMVLVIACTNVANLLLARGVTRQHEIGVRLTLGAGRSRVIRQLLTENVLLCAIGGVVGLGFAVWTLQILQPMILGRLPSDWAAETRRWYFLNVTPDWRVFGFTALLTVVAVLAAGLLPALHTSGAGLISVLKNDGTIFGRRLSQSRLRNLLVVAQVAVCLMLLSCAGLLVRNLFEVKNAKIGFDPRSLWIANVASGSNEDRRAAVLAAAETLQVTPGVVSAVLAQDCPLARVGGTTALIGVPGPDGAGGPLGKIRSFMVAAEFFKTFGIPIVRGRGFSPDEIGTARRVVLVSETTAQRFWPREEAVGKILRVNVSALAGPGAPWNITMLDCEVIGVAGDVVADAFHPDHEVVYLPLADEAVGSSQLFIRVNNDSLASLTEIGGRSASAGVKILFNRPLSAFLEEQMLPFLGVAVLSAALGGLALLMASVGLYGVMAFGVNQRVREIGIRVALGATVGNVVRLFVQQGMKLVAFGAVFGLGGGALFALLLKKVLAALPSTFDPLAFGGVAVIFGAVAFTACWLPARRAAKVDAMVALRAE